MGSKKNADESDRCSLRVRYPAMTDMFVNPWHQQINKPEANLPVLPSELAQLTFEHLFARTCTRRDIPQIYISKNISKRRRTGPAQPYIAHSPAVCLARSIPDSYTLSLAPELSPLVDAGKVEPGAIGSE